MRVMDILHLEALRDDLITTRVKEARVVALTTMLASIDEPEVGLLEDIARVVVGGAAMISILSSLVEPLAATSLD